MKEILQQKLSHAVIIESPDTSQAKACAFDHARAILHTERPENHPDCWILAPEGRSQAIKIEAIREIIEQAQKSTNTATKKVFIIHQADRLNLNAANALLKTLEEPTNDANFFLTATSKNRLLPTIVSRCTVYRIGSQTPSLPTNVADWIKRFSDFIETNWGKDITPFQVEMLCNDITEILKASEDNSAESIAKSFILEKIAQKITSNFIGKVPTQQLFSLMDVFSDAKKIIEFNGSFSQAIEFILLKFICERSSNP